VLTDVEKRANVGVLQRRDGPCLAPESLAPLLAAGETGGQHLECNVAIKPGIAGTINLAHSAGSNECHDLIWTKPDALCQCRTI
jgi:hypothetical protein